jgi:hypothetical protein
MKLKKFFFVVFGVLFFSIFVSIFGNGLLYFLAAADDKLYGEENKYIDPSLTGDALNDPSNISPGYGYLPEANEWGLKIIKFFQTLLKIVGVVLFPLLIYYLFIRKDTGALEYIHNMFSKS